MKTPHVPDVTDSPAAPLAVGLQRGVVQRTPPRKTNRRCRTARCADCGKTGYVYAMWGTAEELRCQDCHIKADAEGRVKKIMTYSYNGRVVSKEEYEAAEALHNSV